MKKLKKLIPDKDNNNLKIGLFKPEIKCSRLTVDSRICNIDKFNEFFQIIDSTKEFKNKLSKDNVYLCSKPKPIYYRNVKSIIEEVYNSGVVTELLPKQAISRLHKKEAPSFRAG